MKFNPLIPNVIPLTHFCSCGNWSPERGSECPGAIQPVRVRTRPQSPAFSYVCVTSRREWGVQSGWGWALGVRSGVSSLRGSGVTLLWEENKMQTVWTIVSLMPDTPCPRPAACSDASAPHVGQVPAARTPKHREASHHVLQLWPAPTPILPVGSDGTLSCPNLSLGKGKGGGSSPTPSGLWRPVVMGEGLSLWKVGRGSRQQAGEWKKWYQTRKNAGRMEGPSRPWEVGGREGRRRPHGEKKRGRGENTGTGLGKSGDSHHDSFFSSSTDINWGPTRYRAECQIVGRRWWTEGLGCYSLERAENKYTFKIITNW